eukprot:2606203-Pyramimonas_sp.AAC.1
MDAFGAEASEELDINAERIAGALHAHANGVWRSRGGQRCAGEGGPGVGGGGGGPAGGGGGGGGGGCIPS